MLPHDGGESVDAAALALRLSLADTVPAAAVPVPASVGRVGPSPAEPAGSPFGSPPAREHKRLCTPQNSGEKGRAVLAMGADPADAFPAAAAPAPQSQASRDRELRAAAAERRLAGRPALPPAAAPTTPEAAAAEPAVSAEGELSAPAAAAVFELLFGGGVDPAVLEQWSGQGIVLAEHDGSAPFVLVQHRGGPCGVLAPLQALLLKHLLFPTPPRPPTPANTGLPLVTAVESRAALAAAMAESLWRARPSPHSPAYVVSPAPGVPLSPPPVLDSPLALQRSLRVTTAASPAELGPSLAAASPAFESGVGALCFLLSALVTRGARAAAADRDDTGTPLVSPPFGHAGLEVVALLLAGRAASHVHDGVHDLGGLLLQGIPGPVKVGFLTLLEAFHLCTVGNHLKKPTHPIWVIGSESHYSVLFGTSDASQAEGAATTLESRLRAGFDARDASGGGGFIDGAQLRPLLTDLGLDLPREAVSRLVGADIVLFSDLWDAVRDHCLPGAGSTAPPQRFELWHLNGIAKPVLAGTGGSAPQLTRLRVTVPPPWTPVPAAAIAPALAPGDGGWEAWPVDPQAQGPVLPGGAPPEASHQGGGDYGPSREAPLVAVVRTRWPRAVANWDGAEPSIV